MKAAIQFQSCMSKEVLKLGKTMERWRLSVPGASGPPTTISLASFRKPRQIADLQLYLDSPKAPMKLGIARRGMQVDGRFALCHAESTRYFHRKKRVLAQPPAISSSGIRQRVPFGSNRLHSTTAYTKQDHCSIFSPAVMIAQSAVNGGAMNAYRFGREQGKPVAAFEPDDFQDIGGNTATKNDKKIGGYSFNLKSNPSEYSEWLQSLSCSTWTERQRGIVDLAIQFSWLSSMAKPNLSCQMSFRRDLEPWFYSDF